MQLRETIVSQRLGGPLTRYPLVQLIDRVSLPFCPRGIKSKRLVKPRYSFFSQAAVIWIKQTGKLEKWFRLVADVPSLQSLIVRTARSRTCGKHTAPSEKVWPRLRRQHSLCIFIERPVMVCDCSGRFRGSEIRLKSIKETAFGLAQRCVGEAVFPVPARPTTGSPGPTLPEASTSNH